MKATLLLPVLVMSVSILGVSAEDVRNTGTPEGLKQGLRPSTNAPATEQTRTTFIVDVAATNTQPASTQRRRSGRATWALDAQPAAILANIAADGFWVSGPNGKETLSLISSVPSVLVGGDIACCDGYLNLRLGGGMLLNSSVGTWFAAGQAGFSLEVQRNVMFGPHIGLSYYAAPEWWGDTEITFDDTMGFLFGLHIVAGDRISYLLSIDYMSISFDIDTKGPGVEVSNNKDKVDMSGLAVQFGLRVQF
jgi:hypothetical protein